MDEDNQGKTREHSSFVEETVESLSSRGNDGLLRISAKDAAGMNTSHDMQQNDDDIWQTIAGVAGNVLEWYDFAVFGFFSDIIGEVFFPEQAGDLATAEAFCIFGGAFLMRPIGGALLGYIGDRYGRKRALVISIFLMAFPTFAMGCLPTYKQIGPLAIVFLLVVRLLQGLSVGGQLMSSLVFTLERQPPEKWGLYGSFVMAGANFGTLLGGLVGFILTEYLTDNQLESWGWRVPFLSGIVVSICGFYLRGHRDEADRNHSHQGIGINESETCESNGNQVVDEREDDLTTLTNEGDVGVSARPVNPFLKTFASENLRSLLAASMVPMLWAAGFYLSFVWIGIYMKELIEDPMPGPLAFGINAAALFVSVCSLFPLAGVLSDRYGRRTIMTIGGLSMGLMSPVLIHVIGQGKAVHAFLAQTALGACLSFWGAPMCAWLVEAFEPEARLTSVAVGYNIAQALAGGSTPFLATLMVDAVGSDSPGWILTILAGVSLAGLWLVPPTSSVVSHSKLETEEDGKQPAVTDDVSSPEFEMVSSLENTPIT